MNVAKTAYSGPVISKVLRVKKQTQSFCYCCESSMIHLGAASVVQFFNDLKVRLISFLK